MFFQMWTSLERVYFLNKERTKYVAIFLDENLTPQVKLTSSSRNVVLNQMQWFILVTFRNDIPKIHVHDLVKTVIPYLCTVDGTFASEVYCSALLL